MYKRQVFNNAADFNGWNEREKLAYLRASLTGTAVQLLWEADDISYAQLVARLKERFGSIGMEEMYQTELRCRRRRDGESIRALAQDIRRLMSLAYPGESDTRLGQHIARDAFLTALNDPELQFEVRKSDPHTLEEAVRLASRVEISRAAVEPATPGRQRVNRRIEDQPAVSQPVEMEIATTPRCVPADICRQPEDGVKHKRRGEMSPAQFSSPKKRGRRV